MSTREVKSILLKVNLKTRLGEVIEVGTRYFPPFPNFIMKEMGRNTIEVEYRDNPPSPPPSTIKEEEPDPPSLGEEPKAKVSRRRK